MTGRPGWFWSLGAIAVRSICFTPLVTDRRPILLNEGHQGFRIDTKQPGEDIQCPGFALFDFPTTRHIKPYAITDAWHHVVDLLPTISKAPL
jgi:hypothetical protein